MISLSICFLFFVVCTKADNVTLYFGTSGMITNYNYTAEYLEKNCKGCRNLTEDIFQGYKDIYVTFAGRFHQKYKAQLLNISTQGVYLSQPSRAFTGTNFSLINPEKYKKDFYPEVGVFYVTILRFDYDVDLPGGNTANLENLRGGIVNVFFYWLRSRGMANPLMSLSGKILLNETSLKIEKIPEDSLRSIMDILKKKYGFTSFIVHQNKGIPQEHLDVLSILSYVGCGLSVIGLSLAIITILASRKLRRIRANQILLHMCIALLGSLLLYVFGILRVTNDMLDACKATSALLHYFLVSAMAWTSVEAYNLYQDLVKVFDTSVLTHAEFMCRASVAGWVIPAIIVVITVVSGPNSYGFHVPDANNQTLCWMQQEAFYGAFLAPILLLVVGNMIVFVIVMREIYRMPQLHEKQSRLAQFRASISVFVLLGLNWVFAGLAATTPTLVMQYLFTISCSFQGFFIFILHGLMKKDFQEAWKLIFAGSRVASSLWGSSSVSQKTHSSSISQNSVANLVQHQDTVEFRK